MAGVVTKLWGGSPRNRGSVAGSDKTYLLQRAQTDSGAHPSFNGLRENLLPPPDVNLPERESDG